MNDSDHDAAFVFLGLNLDDGAACGDGADCGDGAVSLELDLDVLLLLVCFVGDAADNKLLSSLACISRLSLLDRYSYDAAIS